MHTGNTYRTKAFVFSSCLTLVQTVQPGDVVLAHLVGCAEFNIGVGDRHHRGLIVPGEGIPEIIKSAEFLKYI